MEQYRIKFYTEAGGAYRDDEEYASNLTEAKQMIYEDLIENPYLAFYYGLYIDVYENGLIIKQINTKNLKPIKMSLELNGKNYYRYFDLSDALMEMEYNNDDNNEENTDEDLEDSILEALMDDPNEVIRSDKLDYAKLIYDKFSLEYFITI